MFRDNPEIRAALLTADGASAGDMDAFGDLTSPAARAAHGALLARMRARPARLAPSAVAGINAAIVGADVQSVQANVDGALVAVRGAAPTPAECGAALAAMWAYLVDYAALRAAAYPPLTEFADAATKMGAIDPAISAAGHAQMAAYSIACLAVKARYPKPE